jgi:hypothetical protein
MKHAFDRLAKDWTRAMLAQAGGKLLAEYEVAPDAQRVDFLFEPSSETTLDALEPFGLMQRIALEGPCAFEFFHEPPSLQEVLSSLRKALFLRRHATLPARPDEHWLWIISAGRPRALLGPLALKRERTWPRGVYRGPDAFRFRLVVVSELPAAPETLSLRAFGARTTLARAVSEFRERRPGDLLGGLFLPLVVALHLEQRAHPDQPPDQETLEFLMQTQDLYETWREKTKAEGRAEGERTMLRQLLGKFGPLSKEAEARLVAATEDELILWANRVLSAQSIADVFG